MPFSVSNLRVDDLARDVEASMQSNRMMSASLSGAIGSLRERSQLFFSLLPPGDGRFAFEGRREFLRVSSMIASIRRANEIT